MAEEKIAILKSKDSSDEDKENAKAEMEMLFGGTPAEIDGKKYKLDRVVADFDWDNPVLQKDLSTLQVFDVIIGHADRHAENYVVDYDPNDPKNIRGVKGIDNDDAFGLTGSEAYVESSDKINNFAYKSTKTGGIPPVVDAETAIKVLSTKFSDIEIKLNKYNMDKAEIEAARDRFEFTQRIIKKRIADQKVATMGMDPGDQIFMIMELHDLAGLPLPDDIDQRELMKWGSDAVNTEMSKAEWMGESSYVGREKATKADTDKQGKKFKPWEKK